MNQDARGCGIGWTPESDEQIIARLRAGDEGAFDDLARAHSRDIFVLAVGLLGNPEDAQDVTQDVLIALFSNIRRLRQPRALAAWLSRVCVRRCRVVIRRRRRHEPLGQRDVGGDAGNSPEQQVIGAETRAALREAVLGLPPRQQAALVLRHFGGRSTEEIARVLGCTPSTARVHLSRAVARLRDILGERMRDDG